MVNRVSDWVGRIDDLVQSRPWMRWSAPVALLFLLMGVIWGAEFLGESIVIGLTQHAPLILAALGFALIYRLTGLINVAYSETLTLGAYFGWWINTTFGLNFYATLLPTAIMSGLLSVATYFAIFRPAKQRNVGILIDAELVQSSSQLFNALPEFTVSCSTPVALGFALHGDFIALSLTALLDEFIYCLHGAPCLVVASGGGLSFS